MHSKPVAGGLIFYIGRMWHLGRAYQGSFSKGRNVIRHSKDVSCTLVRICLIAFKVAQGSTLRICVSGMARTNQPMTNALILNFGSSTLLQLLQLLLNID